MGKIFIILVLVAISLAVKATQIKILYGIQDNRYVSTMALEPACDDYKEEDEKQFYHLKQYYALIKNRPVVKFYSSKTAHDQLGQALNVVLPGTKHSAGQFLEALRASECPTYIYGGAVRDTLLGLDSKDIDAETDCKPWKVLDICTKKFGESLCHKRGVLINFGHKHHIAEMVDMAPNSDTFYGSANHLEYTPNALAFDYGGQNVIIDLSGTSVEDVCSGKIRIPVPPQQWDAWATIRDDNGKKIFRYWKLKAKGFKPYNKATQDYIIKQALSYIKQDGWFPMKKYYCGIMYGNTYVKFYGRERKEGCLQDWKDCKTKSKKAQVFKNLVCMDLHWRLPSCGDPKWGYA